MSVWTLHLLTAALHSTTLFIGNSYVYYNAGIHNYYASIANAHLHADEPVHAHARALPNYYLRQHVSDGQPPRGENWSTIVLQEQSQAPALPQIEPEYAASKTACAKLAVDAHVHNGACCVVLLQTWGRRDGDSENIELCPSFAAMQARLSAGYESLADEARAALGTQQPTAAIDVRVAPAGEAFAELEKVDSTLFRSLFAADGAHPSVAGSYLAACVVACTIHRELQPHRLTRFVPPELSEEVAERLRGAAHRALSKSACAEVGQPTHP